MGRVSAHCSTLTRRAVTLIAGMSLLALGLMVSQNASADGPAASWTYVASAIVPNGQFSSVSCVSSTAICFVAGATIDSTSGTSAVFVESNVSGSWSQQVGATPTAGTFTNSSLASISCASATFCVAVGSVSNSPSATSSLIEVYSGSAWSYQTGTVPSGYQLTSVSCVAAGSCVAVGSGSGEALVESLVNGTWIPTFLPNPPGLSGGTAALNGISCTSTTACVAVGAYPVDTSGDSDGYAEVLSRGSWTLSFFTGGSLSGISCTAQSDCVAVGSIGGATGLVATLANDGWTTSSVSVPLSAVSCPSSGFCAAIGTCAAACSHSIGFIAELMTTSNGPWVSGTIDQSSPGYHADPTDVSCPSVSSCYAAGNGVENVAGGALWSGGIPPATDSYSYAAGGGTGTAPPSGSGLDGSSITLAASPFSYPGHTFAGWSDGTTTYSAGASYKLQSGGTAITFTAQWNAIPTTSVLIPSSGATVSGSTTTLDASAANATSVQFLLFGGTYGYSPHAVCTASPTIYGWLCSWNTRSVPNGSYILVSYASGTGGSVASPGVSVTVKNSPPPATSVLVPSSGSQVSGSTTLDASATNATSVQFLLFGGSYGFNAHTVCTATPTIYGWLCSWNTATVPNGTYVLVSYASGTGGNGASPGISVAVKN